MSEKPQDVVIPCERKESLKRLIESYAQALRKAAPYIGEHRMTPAEFEESGLFSAAIERLRGQKAASTSAKKAFIEEVLNYLKDRGLIRSWQFTGAGERHDYRVNLNNQRICVFEAKGCLDGNNTTIYERPPDADEFIIWSLCQNPGSDPRKNAWSGIHTRLGGEIIARRAPPARVDGLIIWDMLCGSAARPCPKIVVDRRQAIRLPSEREVPPPCLYTFPRTTPDSRNNPCPPLGNSGNIGFFQALYRAFGGSPADITDVALEVKMQDSARMRRTSLFRQGEKLASSKWTQLKRVNQ